MNWGLKIVLLYTGFVVMILGFVVASAMQEFHMVNDDYYAADLQYESQMERMRNTQALPEQPTLSLDGEGQLLLRFPEGLAVEQGTLVLYRPSDSKLDRSVALALDAQTQRIAVGDLARGLWRIQLNWQSVGKEYYLEQPIVF
ncbi:MAG: hypothetical protein OHK0039_13640 [Bacteroidia bacterium]